MHRIGHYGSALRKIPAHEFDHGKAGIEREDNQQTTFASVMMFVVMMVMVVVVY